MKKRLSPVCLYPCVLAGLALGGLGGCVQDPPPFDPRAAQAWELRTDSQVKLHALYPLPTTAETPYIPGETPDVPADRIKNLTVPEGPPVKMTLQEVVHRAILNNMEVRVATYDTAIDQTRILEAEANFDPTLFWDVNEQRIDKMTPGSLGDVYDATTKQLLTHVTNYDQEQLYTSDIGFRQNLPAGGKAEIKEEIDNVWANPTRGILQSFYQNDLTFTLTQPLLQNFGIEVNRARITIAQNNSRISLLDFRKTLEETVLKIEQVYWQQVQAERDLASLQKAIDESKRLREILYHRFGEDVVNTQIDQANAAVSDREVQLITQMNHIADLSDQLKQLMNDPNYPVSSSAIITPADEGTEQPLHFNLDDQIETAMENRYELGQQQERISSAETAVDVARNNLLPSLTAQLQGTVDGLGGGIGNAFNKEGDFNHLGYQAGLQFEFPLGNRAANAIWQRSLLQRMQAVASYAGLVNQVALDVKTAARAVSTAYTRLIKARNARFYYQKLINDQLIQDKSGNTPLTPDSVAIHLQNQQLLASEELTEHLALNDYNYAIANLEKAKGTILRYDNVLIEQAQLPFDMSVKGNPVAKQMLLGTQPR